MFLIPTFVGGQTVYEPYSFTTFAGTAGVAGSADGTGAAARFSSPSEVAVDQANNLFVADTANHTIRKITAGAVVTTIAGLAGQSGSADGTGSAARFNSPIGVAVDQSGNLFVGDSDNNTIRKITPGGVVTTLAGLAGATGSTDGTGSAARFNGPRGIAVSAAGLIYVCDTFNNTIRKITSSGVVTTLAGLAGATGSTDGAGSAARFNRPREIALDSDSNLLVTDTANNLIRRITPGGVVTTVAGAAGVNGSTDGSVFAARFFGSIGDTVSPGGDIFVTDTVNDTIRKISSVGVVTTLAGMPLIAGSADGTGALARFSSPQGAGLDSAGNLFVSDTGNNTIRRGHAAASPTPSPTVSPSPSPGPSQLLNISTRMRVQTGNNVLIGGFIITGNDPKQILLRALGPSLLNADPPVPGALADPILELHGSDNSEITSNDNWKDTQQTEIEATHAAPSNDLESAILITLDPGQYTAIVRGKNDTSGIGLVEAFDLSHDSDSDVADISTRGFVETGDDVMIGGFILGEGSEGLQILVRGLGPSLVSSGVTDALTDPTLELRNSNADLIGSNDNWKSLQEAELEATTIPPPKDAESALLVNLPPGTYTVILAGKDGGTGVGLVEVYGLK
jgi:sugar lactone lactonase YvrE